MDYFLSQKDSGFIITVLSRKGSSAKFPPGVKEIHTDYSPTALDSILPGQDVVVVFLPPESSVDHKVIMDAAARSGVKRFIPGEFGVRTYHPALDGVLIAEKKRTFIKHLKSLEDRMSWTALINNIWTDFCVTDGLLGFDVGKREAIIYNGGDVPFSTGTRIQSARALYALLSKPGPFEEAKNQFIHIASYTTTQNELLGLLEKFTGEKWKLTQTTSVETIPKALEEMKQGLHWGLGHHMQAVFFDSKPAEALGDFRLLDTWNQRLELPADELESDLEDTLDGKWPIVRFVSDQLPDFKL